MKINNNEYEIWLDNIDMEGYYNSLEYCVIEKVNGKKPLSIPV